MAIARFEASVSVVSSLDEALQRYAEFVERFRSAATPQEEQRCLYALAAFRPRPLVEDTLAKTINSEIRTQDAPFVARAMLMSVDAREPTWNFIKASGMRWTACTPSTDCAACAKA